MKRSDYPLLLITLVIFTFSSCKKENNDSNNNSNNSSNPLSTALGGSPNIPSGAAGALYAVNNHVISDDGYGGMDTLDIGSAYAWFNSYATTTDAGVVSCNAQEIEHTFSGVDFPWYYTISGIVDFSAGNSADWSVAGNTSTGVTGFNHTDNTPFPLCNFSVPGTVNLNNSLTVNCTISGSNDAVFYTIYAQGRPKVTKTMGANATSATFTSAELKSVGLSGGMLGIQVMPVKLTPVTLNGKTYYFVKQYAFAQFSTAL